MADTLATLQQRWADHVRDPSRPAPAGIEPRRLAVYRRLCIDSLDSLLTGSLPRLHARLGPQAWRHTVERYYAVHACRTPLFPRIAAEFAAWLGEAPLALPAWAAELAHFECQQLALRIAEESPPAAIAAFDDHTVLDVAPLVRVLGYRWPVHDDGGWADTAPEAPTLLLLQRDAHHALQAQALTVPAYTLLLAFGPAGTTLARALEQVADEHGQARTSIDALCRPLIPDLVAAGVLYAAPGHRPSATPMRPAP